MELNKAITVKPSGFPNPLESYDLVEDGPTRTMFCVNDHVVAVIVQEWIHDFKTYRVRNMDPWFHRMQYMTREDAAEELWRSISGQNLGWSHVIGAV